ncbi:major facilitator superfamily domain-containing protein [Hyaloraphidium curvatum]|nr:major facilitator superfamily domain-containing protein [Hyaloraphidium curvatum]
MSSSPVDDAADDAVSTAATLNGMAAGGGAAELVGTAGHAVAGGSSPAGDLNGNLGSAAGGGGPDAGKDLTDLSAVPDGTAAEYRVYPQRWFALGALTSLATSASLNWNTLAPVSSRAAAYYETTTNVINWFGLVIYISLIVTGLLSAYTIDSRGLKFALLTGAVLNCAGSWVRYFGTFATNKTASLAIALVGQVLIGIGRPFGTSSTTRLAQTWFGLRERTVANTLASVSPSIGILISSSATSYIVSSPDKVPLAFLIWASYSVVPVCIMIFVPDRPPTPPTPSAEVMTASRHGQSARFKKSLKTAATSVPYLLLWLIMSLQMSIFFVLLLLVSPILLPFGYTPSQVGFLMPTIIIAGWFSLPVAKLVDRYSIWVSTLRVLLVGSSIAFTGLTLALKPDMYWGILLSAAFFGVTNFPVLPIVFELCLEATFPDLQPAVSNYFIFSGAAVWAVVLTPVLGGVQDRQAVLWALTGVSWFTVLLSLLYRGRSRRLLHDTTVMNGKGAKEALKGVDPALLEGDGEGAVELGKGADMGKMGTELGKLGEEGRLEASGALDAEAGEGR